MIHFLRRTYLFKYCPDQIIRKCIPEEEYRSVLAFYHELACGGHFGCLKTAEKFLQSGLLEHFIQKLFQLLQVMQKLPNDSSYFGERHNVPKPYSGS